MDLSAVLLQLLKTPEAGCVVKYTPRTATLGARKCKPHVSRCDRKWTGKKVTARVTWLNQSHLVTSTHLFELEMSSLCADMCRGELNFCGQVSSCVHRSSQQVV